MSALNYKKTSAYKSGSLFAIVDERISEGCAKRLSEDGFEIIRLPRDERLGEAVASHTDMLLFRLGNTVVASREYFEKNVAVFDALKRALPRFEFVLSDEGISHEYPHDAIFNALRIGERLFAKTDTVSREILTLAEREGISTVSVKQGYPACTALSVDGRLVITADEGLARIMESHGIRVLRIKDSESILLPPYKNGFIGGTAGIFGNKVYFMGNLRAHPSSDIIERELNALGYGAVSLDPSSDSLLDLGGIMLINTDENGRSTSPKNPKSE